MPILQLALPVPMRRLFDYRYDSPLGDDLPVQIGARVQVKFANRPLVGIVEQIAETSEVPEDKLKPIDALLDHKPVLDSDLQKLCRWLAQYYQYPLGQVYEAALPTLLRKGEPNQPPQVKYWRYAKSAEIERTNLPARAKKQHELLDCLANGELEYAVLKASFSAAVIKALADKGLIESYLQTQTLDSHWQEKVIINDKPTANLAQSLAITGITNKLAEFQVHLLEGVTGSGKTEVYLQAIEPVLRAGKQVLILVPEIGLTPQTVKRFEVRFGVEVPVLHSNLNDSERLRVWQQAKAGNIPIVIGTRSAIFTPFKQLGMLIVDEEHDQSYKQQDGLRYHARDLAVIRAKQADIPLVLGSATPSLESLNNALNKRYQHHQLLGRATQSSLPKTHLFNICAQPLTAGIAHGTLEVIKQHLTAGNQVLVFANRRGYAPALTCHACGHTQLCQRCDHPYTLHSSPRNLQCHHCNAQRSVPPACENCGSTELYSEGVGTEQLEQTLARLFADYSVARIDSDAIRGKGKLQGVLDKINRLEHQLLIGTQILSKGHHFPHVTLVVILDVDGALYSADYRAAEHLAQLITQLAGRAGRADKPGEMWLQTHEPGHPLLQDLINNGYSHFARYALLERQHAQLPPFCYQALLRAESAHANLAYQFLLEAGEALHRSDQQRVGIQLVGPLPALMEKRQGRFRFQLLIQAEQRSQLQQALTQSLPNIEALRLANKVRWSLDIDPQDFS